MSDKNQSDRLSTSNARVPARREGQPRPNEKGQGNEVRARQSDEEGEEEAFGEIDEQEGLTTLIVSWSGPLPDPSTLLAFDEVVRSGAERIFAQFELEAAHRPRFGKLQRSPRFS